MAKSGNLNTSPSSVYWVNLRANTIAANSALTIYMGFASPLTNIFAASGGVVGEAPMFSPSYGLYDSGPTVFPGGYWNFTGSSLPAGWANIQGAAGYVVNNGVTILGTMTTTFETTAANYPDTAITESNFQVEAISNYGGVMVVNAPGGGQYTTNTWQTVGNAGGNAAERLRHRRGECREQL